MKEYTEELELNEQSLLLIAKGKAEDAIRYLNKAKEINPNYLDTYINLGMAYASLENLDNAESNFRKAMLIDKNNPVIYFHLGNICFLRGNVEEGVAEYNKAIEKGFEDPQIYYNLGMVYEEINKFDMAIRNYSKAINKNKLEPQFRLRQIYAFINNDKFDEALVALEELSKYCPDIFDGYHLRFEIYFAKGEYDKAEKVIDNALELFPKDVSLFYDKIKVTNMLGNYEKALEMIEKAEGMEGFEIEERNLYIEKAKVYAQKEDVNTAIEYLEKAVSLEDGQVDLDSRYILMNALLTVNNYEKLLAQAEIVSKVNDLESSIVLAAHYYKALCLKKLDREEESNNYYKEIIRMYRDITIKNPMFLDAYMFRILCLKDIKEFTKALELIDYVLLLKEDSKEALSTKASIYKAMGEEDKANEILAKLQ